jgi:hypothetical protein
MRPRLSAHDGCPWSREAALGASARLCRFGEIHFSARRRQQVGPRPMIDAGVPRTIPCVFAHGLHVAPELPRGQIEVKSGPFYGAYENLEIIIKKAKALTPPIPRRESSHPSLPPRSSRPLQTVVSRRYPALDSAVITFGKIKGGTRTTSSPISDTHRHHPDTVGGGPPFYMFQSHRRLYADCLRLWRFVRSAYSSELSCAGQ